MVATPASSVGESKVAIKNPPVLSKPQETNFGAARLPSESTTVTEAVGAV